MPDEGSQLWIMNVEGKFRVLVLGPNGGMLKDCGGKTVQEFDSREEILEYASNMGWVVMN